MNGEGTSLAFTMKYTRLSSIVLKRVFLYLERPVRDSIRVKPLINRQAELGLVNFLSTNFPNMTNCRGRPEGIGLKDDGVLSLDEGPEGLRIEGCLTEFERVFDFGYS